MTLLGGAGTDILYSIEEGQSKLHLLLRFYFQRLEQMHNDFVAARRNLIVRLPI